MRIEILAQSRGNETPDWAVMGEDGTMAVFTQIMENTGQTFDSNGWALVRINGGLVLLRYGSIDPSNPGNEGVSFHEPTREFLETEIRSAHLLALQCVLDEGEESEDAAYYARRRNGLQSALDEMAAAG